MPWIDCSLSSIPLLQVTLLVRSADTKTLLINFDSQLLMTLKEAEYMLKNNFEVPESSQMLLHAKDKMKGDCYGCRLSND